MLGKDVHFMKKYLSRVLSMGLVLALSLGLLLIPASAEETELGVVTIGGVSFSVVGESLSMGSQFTASPENIPGDAVWSMNIHISKDGVDRYSAVTPEGELTEFFLIGEVNNYMEYLNIPASETRTFTLTVPEEYADWTVAIRFGYNNSYAEIPLEAVESVSFTDVKEGDWYYNFVIPATDAGWFTGNPDGSFGPNSPLTISQVIVLAARLHMAQTGAQVAPPAEGETWYTPYYNYCLENGLIAEEDGYLAKMDESATRFEMAAIWDKAAWFARVNSDVNEVADGFIPDLAESDPYGEIVYRWYRSGVLTGDSQHKFNGESSITRAEACVIICHLTALVEVATI